MFIRCGQTEEVMASQILPVACHNLPKLFVRGHVWRLSACSGASLKLQSSLQSPSLHSTVCHHPVRLVHTTPVHQMGLVGGIKKRLGMKEYRYNRHILKLNATRLYICLSEQIDFDLFISDLQLDDTFNSWFRVLELHVWLLLVRLSQEGDDGKLVTKHFVESMWKDVEKRSKQIKSSPSQRKRGLAQLYAELQTAICAYDEGMLSDDMVLAGAIWRSFFQSEIVTPKQLETLVCYIRKQQAYLQNQDESAILGIGVVSVLPLYGDEVDEEENKKLFTSIINQTA